MAKNKLYQCPYDKAVKCDMKEGCLGCEDFSPALAVVKKPAKQQLQPKSVTPCKHGLDICPFNVANKDCRLCRSDKP